MTRQRPIQFKLNKAKSVEAIDFLASQWPGITQYFLGKIFYFADKEHYLDWGRPISGDFYVAMKHGPVPSRIYDLLKPGAGEEDDWVILLNKYVNLSHEGNLYFVYSRSSCDYKLLSKTDKEYLARWAKRFQALPEAERFKVIEELAHKDRAWIDAWEGSQSNNPEMDLAFWEADLGISMEESRSHLAEVAKFAAL